jgi:hypothetical protein
VNTIVSYTLTDKNELIVEYRATTDKATPFNPSQHSYFNLTGASRDVLDHEVAIFADRYTPTDTTLIPTGELASVLGTPFDFRKPTTIGARINDSNPQLRQASGYDHNYVINRQGAGLVPARTRCRTDDRPHTGSFDNGAGDAVLYREYAECGRKSWTHVPEVLCILSGDRTLSGFTEQASVPVEHYPSGNRVHIESVYTFSVAK